MFTDDKADLPAPWQWPGLWSLNLPALLVLWQVLFAQSFHVWLGGHHFATAAALIWAFVATERWIFYFRLRPGLRSEAVSEEDLFEQSRSIIRICLLIVAGLILVAIFRASVREIGGMLIWTSLGGGYLLALRLRPESMTEILPREMALAVYLAGTVILFIWSGAVFGPTEILLPGLLFLLLLFYYFSLLVTWSHPLVPVPSTGALFEGMLGLAFRVVPLVMMLGGVILAFVNSAVTADLLLLTIGVSGLLLLLLDIWHRSLSMRASRLLADVALCAPVVPLLAAL